MKNIVNYPEVTVTKTVNLQLYWALLDEGQGLCRP